jgi:sodium-dependent dicarboxylate transporter 2/3/5
VVGHKEIAASYGHTVILLLLGGFLLSAAMERSGAHRRIAIAMVRWVGGASGRRLVLGFMLATAVLSMWISNSATALMMLPIAMAVLQQSGDPRLRAPLLLGIAYSASVGGMATPIGTPPNVIFMGQIYERTGSELPFATWMSIGLPMA